VRERIGKISFPWLPGFYSYDTVHVVIAGVMLCFHRNHIKILTIEAPHRAGDTKQSTGAYSQAAKAALHFTDIYQAVS
jgi:hypothetical protein